jgi:RAD50-interacting protein 1
VLWDHVLTRHRFSTSGAAQLQADLAAICRVVGQAVGSGIAEAGLRKCLEGAQLVGLPVTGGKSESGKSQIRSDASGAPSAGVAEDDWDDWGAEAEGADANADADTVKQTENAKSATEGDGGDLGLWEVETRLFADNQSARDVLDELGIELLTESEARAALGRRVELAG